MNIPQRLRQLAASTGLDAFGDEIRAIADEMDACGSAGTQSDPQAGLNFTGDTQPADVTDADIVAVMRDGNNCNYNDEAEHIQFARAILALRPERVPMTGEQIEQVLSLAHAYADAKLMRYGALGIEVSPDPDEAFQKLRHAILDLRPVQVPMTDREIELIDGMIAVQLDHAQRCDAISNRVMAEKQKGWDMERVELLRRIRAYGITAQAKKEQA